MRFAPMDRKPAAIDAEMPSSARQQMPAAVPGQDFNKSRLALPVHAGPVHKECVAAGVASGTGHSGDEPNANASKRSHVCHLCHKSFFSASYLSQHLRIHSGLKPYSCHVCSRRFTQLSHLQQHRRTHTGERPYKCKQPGCTKAFSQLSNLQSHSRSHMTDRTYKCTSCYKCFLDKESLLSHVPTHLGTRRARAFRCHLCDKSYTQDTYLQNHIKVKHNGTSAVAEKKSVVICTSTQQHQQLQVLQLAEAASRAAEPMLPQAPRQAPLAVQQLLLHHHGQHVAGEHVQRQLLPQQHEQLSSGNGLSLTSLGVAQASVRSGEHRFFLGLDGRQQPSPKSGSWCDGGSSSSSSSSGSGGVRPPTALCPQPAMAPLVCVSASSEQAMTVVAPEPSCPGRSPLLNVSADTTTQATLPLMAAGPQDLLLSTTSEKKQVAAPVALPSILDQIGGGSMRSHVLRSPVDTPSYLTSLGESCKADPNWQLGGPVTMGDGGCPNYFSPYMQSDLQSLQMSLSQREPYRWPSCSAELDPHGFGFAPGGGGHTLANPALGQPYWLCSDSAYKPSTAILSRGLFGGSSGDLFDGVGGAVSPYGIAVTQSVAPVEPFSHSDLLSLTKVPGHSSGFGNVHFPGQ